MERLTKKNSGGDYYYPKCYEKCSGNGTSEKCNECSFNYAICQLPRPTAKTLEVGACNCPVV